MRLLKYEYSVALLVLEVQQTIMKIRPALAFLALVFC